MARSQNGWSASPSTARRPLVVNGVEFVGGIRDDDDVEIVLRYCMEQYAARVEPLRNPGCWGGSYRANRNDPNSLSNHASWTAIDANAPDHPNGVPTSRTFTHAQIVECEAICAEVDNAVRWGGAFISTPDAMHWEVNVGPEELHRVAERLRDDMPYSDWPQKDRDALIKDLTDSIPAAVWGFVVEGKLNALRVLQRLGKAFDNNGKPKS